jgi:hypothetical protein
MNRDQAAFYVGEHFGQYLTQVAREATDTPGNLAAVIDDALRALGYVSADIPSAEPTLPESEEDLRVQLDYRTMLQVVRDLGVLANIASEGDSIQLRQIRENAEKDLAITAQAVLERFKTLGVVSSTSDDAPFGLIDLNYNDDPLVLA